MGGRKGEEESIRERGGKGQRERQRRPIPWFTPQCLQQIWSGQSQEPDTLHGFLILVTGSKRSGHLLVLSQGINSELDGKSSSWDC